MWTVSFQLVIFGGECQPAVSKIAQWWKGCALLPLPTLICLFWLPPPSQAASLPMSIIIVGVGPAEFDGK